MEVRETQITILTMHFLNEALEFRKVSFLKESRGKPKVCK
jgi:hypothetical protein